MPFKRQGLRMVPKKMPNLSNKAAMRHSCGMNLDDEYNNRKRVPDFQAIIDRWKVDAAAYRAAVAAQSEIDVPYGATERNRLDLFWAARRPGAPLCVFIHGGYWRSLDKSLFSHVARGVASAGCDVAVLEYTLCPAVTVAEIIDEMRQACLFLWQRYRRPLVVAGHSAGGHLAAAMLATGWAAYGAPEDLVQAVFSLSGIFDLRPMIATAMNEQLRLDDVSARIASPLLWPAPGGGRGVLRVGAQESAEFLRQSASLQAAWGGVGLDVGYGEVPGENHFSIVGRLADPASPLTVDLLSLLGR